MGVVAAGCAVVSDLRAADVAKVFDHFGIEPTQDESYHPWSPVFPADWQGRAVVLKRGAKRPDPVAGWCRLLDSVGIPVVAPVELPADNPAVVDGQTWIVYPWVSGRRYNNTEADLTAAGDLLGRIHAAPQPAVPLHDLDLFEYSAEEAAADLDALRARFTQHAPDDVERLMARLDPLVRDFTDVTVPALRDPELPVVSVCADFKADNLVYTVDGPVLVDPESAVRASRIYDLALAALLFHTSCAGAPGRLFTTGEWRAFRDAYLAHVRLTDLERRRWPDAIDFILGDEGIWAILDSTEWQVERQRAYLVDLAGADRHAYELPGVSRWG
jgi:Ser/Thr protein kinase RdoA (MazF antagonist)